MRRPCASFWFGSSERFSHGPHSCRHPRQRIGRAVGLHIRAIRPSRPSDAGEDVGRDLGTAKEQIDGMGGIVVILALLLRRLAFLHDHARRCCRILHTIGRRFGWNFCIAVPVGVDPRRDDAPAAVQSVIARGVGAHVVGWRIRHPLHIRLCWVPLPGNKSSIAVLSCRRRWCVAVIVDVQPNAVVQYLHEGHPASSITHSGRNGGHRLFGTFLGA
mmetsp:Transcript_19971/g.56581  ORF Transcript_19971/g.56581 Transcript_19971/m.56581 type:complete len:216 (-) Transcript_19971:774-1421(-)